MITRKRQWVVAKEEIAALNEKMESGKYRSKQMYKFKERMDHLESEIAEYEELKAKGLEVVTIERPEDIMLLPARYRVAKGMSIDEFSEMTGVSARMIYRYENRGYTNVTGRNLSRILAALPVGMGPEERGDMRAHFKWSG